MLSYFSVFYRVVCGLVFILGASGNVIVLLIVAKFSHMQTTTNLLLIGLALADLLYLCSVPLFLARNLISFTLTTCRIFWMLSTVNWFASTFTLVLISADRYIAVCCEPQWSLRIRTPRNALLALGLAWLAAAAFMSPAVLSAVVIQNNITSACHLSSEYISLVNHTLNGFVFGYLIPVVLIITFYTLLLSRLMKRQAFLNRSTHRNSAATSKATSQRGKKTNTNDPNRNVTRLVLSVIIVFLTMWTPYWLNQVSLLKIVRFVVSSDLAVLQVRILILAYFSHPVKSTVDSLVDSSSAGPLQATYAPSPMTPTEPPKPPGPPVSFYLSNLAQLLGYTNCMCNPIIYAFMSTQFHESFVRILTCQWCPCRRSRNSTKSTSISRESRVPITPTVPAATLRDVSNSTEESLYQKYSKEGAQPLNRKSDYV